MSTGTWRMIEGDCREVLPTLGDFDVVIADPPYNVGKDYGDGHDDALGPEEWEAWLREVLAMCAARAPEVVFFPGWRNLPRAHALIPSELRWYRTLGWHKREFAGDKWNGGPAMCWEPIIWASRAEKPAYVKRFGTFGRDFYVVNATHGDPFAGPGRHPNPKPLPVLRWLVGLFCEPGARVLDPFAGTGTTLRAAHDAGCSSVGIERNPAYIALAHERMAQPTLESAVA